MSEQDIKTLDDGIIFEIDDDNVQPLFVFIQNSIHGYISAIHEFWFHQTFKGLHLASEPH